MRKSKKRKLRKTVLTIVDRESEQIYLNSFKNSNIHIKPEFIKKKSLNKLYYYFKKERKNYDKTFWIINLDVPIRENRVNEVKDYIKNYKDDIIINHPCLEFWFALHFEFKNFGLNCSDVLTYLKRKDEFKDYDKSKIEVQKTTELLKDRLNTAIKNAKEHNCDLESLINCSLMYKFFEELKNLEE